MMRFLLVTIICFLGTSSLWSQHYKFGKISIDELSQSAHPREPEAAASILFRSTNTDFKYNSDKGFYAMIDVVERIKIYTKEGTEQATISVPLYKGYGVSGDKLIDLKAYTYELVNGEIKETKLSKDGVFNEERSNFLDIKKFTMPNVQPGSVIEYKYTISTSYIGNLDPYYFQETIPVDKVELRFSAPEWMNYRLHKRGWYPFEISETIKRDDVRFKTLTNPSSTDTGAFRGNSVNHKVEFLATVYKVSLENVTALEIEPYTNNLQSYRSGIQFELNYTKFPNSPLESYATSWEDVAKGIYEADSFGGQLESTRLFKKLTPKIVSPGDTEEQKIAKIYSYVRSNVTWNGNKGIYASNDLDDIIEEKTGNDADINLLLVGLLRQAGLNANPVLISSKDNGIPIFPTRSGFDYVVAGVGDTPNPLLLDAANRLSAPQVLDENLLNWNGWLIREDGSSRNVSLFPKKAANQTALVDFKIEDGYIVTGTSRSRVSGHIAQQMRYSYDGLSPDDQRAKMESNLNPIEIDNVSTKEMDNPFKPLTLSYDFENKTFVEEIGSDLYVSPLGQYATTTNPFTAESRTFPIDFKFPKEDRLTLTWTVPEGYEVESLPQGLDINLQDGLGSYKYSIIEINGKIKVSILRNITRASISATSYNDIKEYYKLMLEKESEKVKIKKI